MLRNGLSGLLAVTVCAVAVAPPCLGQATAKSPDAVRQAGHAASFEQVRRYTVEELNDVLTKEIPDLFQDKVAYTKARSAVTVYRVTYPSVIPERGNRPTMASGMIAIPDNHEKAMPVVEYQHGTVYGKQHVPSFPDDPNTFETRLMLAQFAGQGYVVIAADYFGMGTSREKEGYIVLKSHQQACLDLYEAARVVLDQEQIAITDFFIAGWSQGGIVTMSFLEKIESVGIPIRAAATASAPCDGIALLCGYLSFPRKIDANWDSSLFILMAFSLQEYHKLPGLAEGLFTPEGYRAARLLYDRKKLEKEDLSIILDLHKLIRTEYFDSKYFVESVFGRLVGELHPYRWAVRTPVRMYYGGSDEVVRPELARLPMEYQKAMGNDNVVAISIGDDGSHRKTFGRAVSRWKEWFDSKLHNAK